MRAEPRQDLGSASGSEGSTPPCECDGSGKIVDRIDHSDEPWRDIGHGLQIGGGMSITSRLCECRKNLPPRDGVASWWTSETVWTEEIELGPVRKTVTIEVTCEVPISEENYIVVRNEENAYYPAMLEVNGTLFMAEDARRLATSLVSCAERAEALDAFTRSESPSGAVATPPKSSGGGR